MVNNAEYNIFANSAQVEHQKQLKKDLELFIKQEEQLISFSTSSPRF